jgi:hypothetical protein
LQARRDFLLFHAFIQAQHEDVAGARRQLEQCLERVIEQLPTL